MSAALDAIAKRLERLSSEPEHAATRMERIVAPVLRVFKWEPKLETTALAALVGVLGAATPDRAAIGEKLAPAVEELGENVETLEQACAVDGHPPPAYLTWLERIWKLFARTEQILRGNLAIRPIDWGLAAPPLVEKGGRGRTLGLAATVDPLLAAARAEQTTLGRRRRLLEAARQALLESAAAAVLDAEAVEARSSYIAREVALIDRMQALGLSPRVSLVHQARTAVSRGDVQKAHAALVALDGAASRSGDAELARLTGQALGSLWRDGSPYSAEAAAESLARSGTETFSADVRGAVSQGLEATRERFRQAARSADPETRIVAERRLQLLDDEVEDALLLAALHVDGCFDVGGVLCPERAVEEHQRIRQVTFPTQDMALLPAHSVEDVKDALIDDPRRIVHDFVAGRLLTRRYVAEETVRTERTVMRGEVRAYVLDGSASMVGPRARMRDAILLAELSTLLARYADKERRVAPVLHYRYFDVEPGPVTRVQDPATALAAVEKVVSTLHTGGTDIQRALLTTFDDVRAAREHDPSLARAQIVLVTDGAALVDRDAVIQARSAVGTLPIGVSIIALGEENAALRDLAAYQRSHGEPVFYHFIPDGELADIAAGRRGTVSIHLPSALTPSDLGKALGSVVEEIAALERLRAQPSAGDEALLQKAYDAVGLAPDDRSRGASEARLALASRDEAALARLFERWFPAPRPVTPGANELVPPEDDAACLESIRAVLGSTAQVIDMVGSSTLERRIDAIELVERLLFDAGIPASHYAELLGRYPHALAAAIAHVRSAADASGRVPTTRPGTI